MPVQGSRYGIIRFWVLRQQSETAMMDQRDTGLQPTTGSLLDPSWHIKTATNINDFGYIAGIGIDPNRTRTCVLLTPIAGPPASVPEPSTFAMFLGLGKMTLIAAWRRRKRPA
jgi:hypothetical protein